MATIPGSMFVAPGSCHDNRRKYNQLQKKQQSQDIVIEGDGRSEAASPVKIPTIGLATVVPIGTPVGSPVPPLSPLTKVFQYLRQFSNPSPPPSPSQSFNLPNNSSSLESEPSSPINSPR